MKQPRDPAKSVLMGNSRGEYAAFSTEETLASGINQFQGWLCAAGSESIHVGVDGWIQWAACKVYGGHGNVFQGDIEIPKDWIVCNKKACMCGGDMQIRKAKSMQYRDLCENVNERRLNRVEKITDVTYVGPYHYPKAKEQPCTISWDMGRRCNYACSYCPEEVSNRTDPLLSWEKMKFATDRMIKEFARGRQVKWVVTGGEPTIIPSYLDWVKYVRGFDHIVHTTTNGSRGARYLEQLIEFSCIGLSVHLEYLDLARLEETVQAIILKKRSHPEAAKWWFGVRVMVPPGRLALALQVKERLTRLPHFDKEANFFMSPVHHYQAEGEKFDFGDLMEYQPDELRGIQAHT